MGALFGMLIHTFFDAWGPTNILGLTKIYAKRLLNREKSAFLTQRKGQNAQ